MKDKPLIFTGEYWNQILLPSKNNIMSKKFKTTLPEAISTIEEAKKFLRELHSNGEHYHCEDDANDCFQGAITKKTGNQLNKLMQEIYNLKGNEDARNLTFDPCGFLLMEMREFKTIDLTGREYHGRCSGNDLLDSVWGMMAEVVDEIDDAERSEIGELIEWIENADDGDEYQTNDTKYIRIS